MRSNSYNSSSNYRGNTMNRHNSHHNQYSKSKPQRHNTFPQNRPYPHSQHSHRSAHSNHTHSPYDHSNRSLNHAHSQQRRHASLHSNHNGSRNSTHNLSSHSNRIRNNHHNTSSVSTSHRPHSNHSPQRSQRNIRHSIHSQQRASNRNNSHQNDKVRRSRNIRNINTSHTIQSETKTNVLLRTMNALSFDDKPYKYDYHSLINTHLLSVKHTEHLSGEKVFKWKYSTEIEKKYNVRSHMLLCLKLMNNMMAMDEATDFIFSPLDPQMNPSFCSLYKEEIKGENMWLLKVKNLILSDVYESVDHFANDVRLIFSNTIRVFGYHDNEWSKNALCLQSVFEEGLIGISREIMNAETMFKENGNPLKDPKQIENKIEIDRWKEMNCEKEKEEVIKGEICFEKKEIVIDKPEIVINKRRRASKQKLKINLNIEEGEIVSVCPLNDIQLDQTDIWFEFINEYKYYDDIKSVIMIQESFMNNTQFEEYKMKLESIGSDLSLNIKDKRAEIQCKIYQILESAKNKITATKPLSLDILRELINNKQNIKNRRKYKTNEAIKIKEKAIEIPKKEEIMDLDQDSDGSFDDNLYFDHDITIPQSITNNNKILSSQLPQSINGGYRPIRPNNVDDQDIDEKKKWDQFNYTKQQQEDCHEEIDF